MSNRFAGRIRSGDIRTPEELKSEFKALAKETHPDLAGPGAGGEEFSRVRAEYESALRDFERHRFGARDPGGRAPSAPGPGEDPGGDGEAAALASLHLLLRRGFPKTPRHEKERLRYEYARWRFERRAAGLGPDGVERFEAFERGLAALKGADPAAARGILSLVAEMIEYRRSGVEAMRTSIAHGLERVRRRPLPPGVAGFLELLVDARLPG